MIILSLPYLNSVKLPTNYLGWKEYRLDYSLAPTNFPEKLIDENSIITIRDPKEGGINAFPLQEKIKLYNRYIITKNCLVDLELCNARFLNKLPRKNVILSYHNFSDDWEIEILKSKITQATKSKPKFIKLAVNITRYTQLVEIRQLLSQFSYPIIFVGMGFLGKQSRILFRHLGSAGTYLGLEQNTTAPGQLTLFEAGLYNLKKLNSATLIGGLVGGEQVYHSLGMAYFNNYFKDNNLNAVYVPLPISQLNDFLFWQKEFATSCYGFSITMPFKQEIAQLIGGDKKNINLYLPDKNASFNTDKIAFLKAIESLGISPEDKILIYGSGATAEMALQALDSHKNVFIFGRNNRKVTTLREIYSLTSTPEKNEFDLVINCTPLGMSGEDFITQSELPLTGKFIDLPYTQEETPLVRKCRQNKIPVVDGKQFWLWQSNRQLKEFENIIRTKITTFKKQLY